MSAFEDFLAVAKKTDTMQSLLQNLEEGPARLLYSICKEYEATHELVPDHHLNLTGYFGEAMLRVLLSANMVTRESGGRFFLYGFTPTETGLGYYKAMLAEKKF
ncbi:MAG: hypothetical protein U9R04_01415 [Chloroflexota bacterium]|nr:hypothetical protein [Chloroflexota bacterium]